MLKDFNETFAAELRDPEFAVAYLEATLDDGNLETFLVALQNVARANGGLAQVSKTTSLSRESLYKALSEQGNPEFKTVQAVLSALGLRLSVARKNAAA